MIPNLNRLTKAALTQRPKLSLNNGESRDESQDKWRFKDEISLVAITFFVSASPHQTGQNKRALISEVSINLLLGDS
ncbi:hypothetical protein QUB56_34750 [Microcoleus sp. AR_TQ3_B6]|uniref:hypothetical protein n=1 Tax=Microcoleus sp. AR_TQ3_B6 TaxID=3055284 RepID=UPI002FD1A840